MAGRWRISGAPRCGLPGSTREVQHPPTDDLLVGLQNQKGVLPCQLIVTCLQMKETGSRFYMPLVTGWA
jgi:hypothetical protein